MPQSRVPFSATVDPTTLEVLDEIAEERDESRSGTVDAVVEEWVQQQQRLESAGQEIDQLREQLNAERERAEQAEQERRELAEKERADDSGGPSVYLRGAWLALGLSVAAAVAALFTFFVVASVLPSPSTWQIAGAVGLLIAQILAAFGFGLGVSEVVAQIRHHDAELAEAVGEVVRGSFGRAD